MAIMGFDQLMREHEKTILVDKKRPFSKLDWTGYLGNINAPVWFLEEEFDPFNKFLLRRAITEVGLWNGDLESVNCKCYMTNARNDLQLQLKIGNPRIMITLSESVNQTLSHMSVNGLQMSAEVSQVYINWPGSYKHRLLEYKSAYRDFKGELKFIADKVSLGEVIKLA